MERGGVANPPIVLATHGFMAGGSDGSASEVRWQDITEVRAFKLDLLTWDEVRLVFVLTCGAAIEVSEEQPGFKAMVAEAIKQIPSLAGWQNIMQPAFARNETVLLHREAQQVGQGGLPGSSSR